MADSVELLAAGSSATGSGVSWRGGRGTFYVVGTFGGTTASMQWSPDSGTTWIDVGTDTILTANGQGNFELPACTIRCELDGGSSISVASSAVGIPRQ